MLFALMLLAANAGDVAVNTQLGFLTEGLPPMELVHFNASGQLLSRESNYGAPVATDRDLNLYVWNGNHLDVRNRFGQFVRTIPLPFVASTAIVVDMAGNVFVMNGGVVAKVAPDGTVLATRNVGAAYRMDLMRDQCTLVYPSPTTYRLQKRNFCTNAPPIDLDRFAVDVRVLPDDRIVALAFSDIYILDAGGHLLDAITFDDDAVRMAVSDDAESVWVIARHRNVLERIRLSDGATIARASPPSGWTIGDNEFAVYGERRAANAPDVATDIPALNAIGAAILIVALMVIAARQVA